MDKAKREDVFYEYAAATIAVVCVTFWFCVGFNHPLPAWQVFLFALLLLPACIAAKFLRTLIHELGHLIAGRLVGYRLGWIRVGPFTLHRKDGSYSCSFTKDQRCGRIFMERGESYHKLKEIIYTAGGGAANGVCAVLCLGWSIPQKAVTIWTISVFFFGVINAWSAIKSLDARTSAGYSDGRLLRHQICGLSKAALSIKQAWNNGVRPRGWDRNAIQRIRHEPGLGAWAYVVAFFYCLDSGDLRGAEVALDGAVAHVHDSEPLSTDILLEAAAFYAGYKHSADDAQRFLDQVKSVPTHEFATARRALIALAYAKGETEKANRLLARSLAQLDTSTEWSRVPYDWLVLIREWNSKPLSAASSA